MNIRVMTYNIRSGMNLQGERDINFAASVINQADADIIGLNEVRNNTSDNGNIDQVRELSRLTGRRGVFGRSLSILGGEYGNALLTRFPLLEHSTIDIPDAPRIEDNFYEHRVLLRCALDVGGCEMVVYSTHFGLALNERETAVRCALEHILRETRPVLLMGDFNAQPNAAELAPLYAHLSDCCAGQLEPRTFPSDKPTVKIDYIFTRGARLSSGMAINTCNSDHRPLISGCMLHS